MIVSQVINTTLASYLRLDSPDNTELAFLTEILSITKSYMSSYTGLPITSVNANDTTLDSYEDLSIAELIIAQDMYDNRSLEVKSESQNKIVTTILDMHSVNLL